MKKHRIDWIKQNSVKLIIAVIIVLLFFILFAIFKKIIFDVAAILFGFASFFYFNNSYKSYIEKNKFVADYTHNGED